MSCEDIEQEFIMLRRHEMGSRRRGH